MGEQEPTKWEGETIVEINLTPQQVWPLLADFCSLNKWLPHIDKCYLVEGVEGELGMVRCCESSTFGGSGAVQYAKEKLLAIDTEQMFLSYEILDNNAGFNSYASTMQLFPVDGDDGKCTFVWTFVAEPVEGFTQDGFRELLKAMAHAMAKKMEEAYYQT